jgi:hypothetical protein
MHAQAQQFLTGKIYKANSTEHLVSVSIHNITQQRYDLSEEDGSYRIQAAPGDHISFSSVGYKADTVTVTASLLTAAYPVYLDVRAQTLQAVRVVNFRTINWIPSTGGRSMRGCMNMTIPRGWRRTGRAPTG